MSNSSLKKMNGNYFWEIINKIDLDISKRNTDECIVLAVNVLATFSIEDVYQFEEILTDKLFSLDRRDIACHIYDNDDSGFSQDAFLYARCYIVAKGFDYYNSVLSDPSIVSKESEEYEFESLLNIPYKAFQAITGKDIDKYNYVTTKSYESCSNIDGWA